MQVNPWGPLQQSRSLYIRGRQTAANARWWVDSSTPSWRHQPASASGLHGGGQVPLDGGDDQERQGNVWMTSSRLGNELDIPEDRGPSPISAVMDGKCNFSMTATIPAFSQEVARTTGCAACWRPRELPTDGLRFVVPAPSWSSPGKVDSHIRWYTHLRRSSQDCEEPNAGSAAIQGRSGEVGDGEGQSRSPKASRRWSIHENQLRTWKKHSIRRARVEQHSFPGHATCPPSMTRFTASRPINRRLLMELTF